MQKTYIFNGRKNGSQGITYYIAIKANNQEQATELFYKDFEHGRFVLEAENAELLTNKAV